MASAEVLPSVLACRQGSGLFAKKLVAVAVSNLAFLHRLFPAEAFADRSVARLSVKLLRQRSNPWPEAAALAEQLMGVFEALDRRGLE